MSQAPPPVDTLEPPHEPVVPAAPSFGLWAAVLSGPVVWFAHFMVVYLVAEAVCTPDLVGGEQPWTDTTLSVFVIAMTVAALGLCAIGGFYAWRRADSANPELRWVGVALATGSAASVVAVGLPAVLVGPC